jgi:putative PIN family toxin of toxin-antitoxin system
MKTAVFDTNVLVAASRSRTGASAALVRMVVLDELRMLASVPLFVEYEAVLLRPEHLLASKTKRETVEQALNELASKVEPVLFHFLWRPQLPDPGDEMVLETAINGRADWIVTFNVRHFHPATRFGIEAISPGETLRRLQ